MTGATSGSSGAEGGRIPDFFIVGHQKCGTTALYLMLMQHPQIFMSTPKEPRYFAPDLRFPRSAGMLENRKRPYKLEHYLSLFADARPDQLAGEASAWYLRSSVAAAEIGKVQPAARIIAILREPASYLRSFHLQMLHSHQETQKDFRKAIALEETRRNGRRIPRGCPSPPALLYSDHVKYIDQLRRYHEVFPREQVLVLIYDDFRADNQATVRSCFGFLGIDDGIAFEEIRTRPLAGVRLTQVRKLVRASRLARRKAAIASPAGKAMNALVPRRLRDSDFVRRTVRRALSTAPPSTDDEFMSTLRRRFKPEVEALSDYLGRDLVSLWGYQTVD
jgi:Sulfotransferase family